jgi:elongation factor G
MAATHTPRNWRNFGVIAHIDAGKTTLTERMLLKTGEIRRTGEVHDGASTMDHMDLERERGITIAAAATQCEWRSGEREPCRLTIIDTPGHIDFSIEVERSLRVLDGAVAVFCAVGGVQPQSETVWRQARRHGVPLVAFVNKMDRAGASFEGVLRQLREKLGANALPVAWPEGQEEGFAGVHDLIGRRTLRWADAGAPSASPWPAEQAEALEARRQALAEALAEHDDELLAAFVEGSPIEPEAMRRAMRRATIAGAAVPALPGSAFKNKGVEPLLDAIADFLPSPAERPAPVAEGPGGPESVAADADAPLAALVFKVVAQEHGALAFVRVYRGRMAAGDKLASTAVAGGRRVGRLCVVKADRTSEVPEAQAGEIVAVSGWRDARTGETISSEARPVRLEAIRSQEPVIAWALSPKSAADVAKMGAGLGRLSQEDPSLRIESDPQTGQTVLWGMGELHLDVALERLRREFGAQASHGEPRVACQEILARAAGAVEGKLAKQSGGKGQFARVLIEFAPREDGKIVFEDRTRGGVVPKGFVPAVERGVRQACEAGPQGWPVVGLSAWLVDGEAHSVDSSELAFQRAGAMAAQAAFELAGTVRLEPVMRLSVQTPAERVGDVVGDLQRRQGRLAQIEETGELARVDGFAPLSRLAGYATALRSLTQGRASASMELHAHEPAREEPAKPARAPKP